MYTRYPIVARALGLAAECVARAKVCCIQGGRAQNFKFPQGGQTFGQGARPPAPPPRQLRLWSPGLVVIDFKIICPTHDHNISVRGTFCWFNVVYFTHAAQSLKPGVAVPTLPQPERNSKPPKLEYPTAYIELKLVQ